MKLGKIKDKEVVGFCAKEYDIFKNITRRIIIIDKTYWDRLDYKVRQLLIWHELGHCLFNKKHDNLLMHDGCPNSIMHPTILSDRCVELHYETYLQQIL